MASTAGERCKSRRLCVCTRIHQNNADRPVDLTKVQQFLEGAIQYADVIAVAVGLPPPSTTPSAAGGSLGDAGDKARIGPDFSLVGAIARAAQAAVSTPSGPCHGEQHRGAQEDDAGHWRVSVVGLGGASDAGDPGARRICLMVVTPWGRFTPALNALLSFAARNGADLALFQSLEAAVSKDAVLALESRMGPEDLVVGAALAGHAFRPGETLELTGVTTPWNTLALWDVPKLSKLGFMGVAEGLVPGVAAGVEEVTAIATLQALHGPDRTHAKLVRLPQVEWQTEWEDEGRRRWHESKMASKVERARAQMHALGIKSGVVEHVDAVEPVSGRP